MLMLTIGLVDLIPICAWRSAPPVAGAASAPLLEFLPDHPQERPVRRSFGVGRLAIDHEINPSPPWRARRRCSRSSSARGCAGWRTKGAGDRSGSGPTPPGQGGRSGRSWGAMDWVTGVTPDCDCVLRALDIARLLLHEYPVIP